eukprot:TRINITY_DN5190_c0_g1_i1.p1 TRINITY_DN5190_c0_g1~~TRINITY_DN5190_c0_g1_i1.p1  ORF type:complete len:261 (+),score=52.57 TRINITY_DN5190_c0_g1_i1:114-896(+)
MQVASQPQTQDQHNQHPTQSVTVAWGEGAEDLPSEPEPESAPLRFVLTHLFTLPPPSRIIHASERLVRMFRGYCGFIEFYALGSSQTHELLVFRAADAGSAPLSGVIELTLKKASEVVVPTSPSQMNRGHSHTMHADDSPDELLEAATWILEQIPTGGEVWDIVLRPVRWEPNQRPVYRSAGRWTSADLIESCCHMYRYYGRYHVVFNNCQRFLRSLVTNMRRRVLEGNTTSLRNVKVDDSADALRILAAKRAVAVHLTP